MSNLSRLFGLDPNDLTDADVQAIKDIEDFVKDDDKESGIRKLENSLGSTSMGERRIDKVHRYVKLRSLIE